MLARSLPWGRLRYKIGLYPCLRGGDELTNVTVTVTWEASSVDIIRHTHGPTLHFATASLLSSDSALSPGRTYQC